MAYKKKTDNPNMGRPKIEIDKNIFENLCGLQCTMTEICYALNITDKTLTNWCKETYDMSFSEVFNKKRSKGLISLRRSQWKLAEKNTAMAIWLGKQYLNQREPESKINDNNIEDLTTLADMLGVNK